MGLIIRPIHQISLVFLTVGSRCVASLIMGGKIKVPPSCKLKEGWGVVRRRFGSNMVVVCTVLAQYGGTCHVAR